MPRIQSLIPLLRPLTAPLPRQASQQFLRFSVATRLRIEQTSAPTSSSTLPPNAVPKPTEAPSTSPDARSPACAADLAAAEADSAQAPSEKPTLPSKRPKETSPGAEASVSPSSESTPPTDYTTTPTQQKVNAKPKLKKTPKSHAPKIELPPPKYHVTRSSSKNLPIYTDYKRGGNLHLTTIRKVTGDLSALRDELRVFLNKKNEEVKINSLTSHVIVKGHHVPEVTDFLKARGM
ncbi:hypothetical protein CC80DRAFT_548144 [Byssothecium circinans]|uniref:Large ribosomal subunit protein mL49 n=1 Tax=Byssothecium circinans TaxID=147558 RepID=A0A6A5TY60_9PLEO|nr:hypothetical protein CC80DRAFT_548144 [Byssothecium circinans]